MLLITSIGLNLVDMPFVFCTIYNIVRNQASCGRPTHAQTPTPPSILSLAITAASSFALSLSGHTPTLSMDVAGLVSRVAALT